MIKSTITLAVIAFTVAAQTPADRQGPVQFDAATIKLTERGPGDRRMQGGPGTASPGRVTWPKVWLRDLITKAFQLVPENVSGPDWLAGSGGQLYLFTATMPADTSEHDFELMLQAFLIEQFRIKFHHETKNFPAYDLIAAPGGTKLTLSTDQTADPSAHTVLLISQQKVEADGFPSLPPGHGMVSRFDHGYYMRFQDYTLAQLADFLGSMVTPTGSHTGYVTDKTGLTGLYDVKLKYDGGDRQVVLGSAAVAAGATQAQGTDPSGLPNIFKAVEQQLGLKLVKAKDIPKDTIVVDHAEKTPLGN